LGAGLLAPFRLPDWRALRFLPSTYAACGHLYLAGNGKAYYVVSFYPALLGLGAVPPAAWLATRSRRILLFAAIAASAALSAYLALPLVPVRSLQGSAPAKINLTSKKRSDGCASHRPSRKPGTRSPTVPSTVGIDGRPGEDAE
jgi:hypothetical protein